MKMDEVASITKDWYHVTAMIKYLNPLNTSYACKNKLFCI